MPEHIGTVVSFSFRLVQYKPKVGFKAKYVAAMYDGIRQARIPAMPCDEKVERTARCPLLDVDIRETPPRKRASRFGLINTVNLKCIMICGSAKHLPFRTSAGIHKRSRIYEHVPALNCDLNAECVGMAVPATTSTLRSRING